MTSKLNDLYKSYIKENFPDKGEELTREIIEIIKEHFGVEE